jgi:hypothetical protein
MKILDFFRKNGQKDDSSRFSDFFLYAPENKKKKVLEEAVRKANEEQREILMKSRLKTKTG